MLRWEGCPLIILGLDASMLPTRSVMVDACAFFLRNERGPPAFCFKVHFKEHRAWLDMVSVTWGSALRGSTRVGPLPALSAFPNVAKRIISWRHRPQLACDSSHLWMSWATRIVIGNVTATCNIPSTVWHASKGTPAYWGRLAQCEESCLTVTG